MRIDHPYWAEHTAKAIILIRVLVGWVFVSEGMQKFSSRLSLGSDVS